MFHLPPKKLFASENGMKEMHVKNPLLPLLSDIPFLEYSK